MAGFEFGNVQDLNARITLLTFLAVIIFVIFFDFLVGLMEYFLSGSQLYNRMIQMIYKELMLMGLVSFTILMVEASQKASQVHNVEYHHWILGVEFSHILIFYLTFFFVAHAFYLMRTAVVCALGYRRMFCEKVPNLIEQLEGMNSWERYFFNLQYIPLSPLRDRIEFKLVEALFNETYFLCDNFNFASYLSGCFDRYALKTINRSMFTWIILMVLAILNYGRIRAGFAFHDCHDESSDDFQGLHRRLIEEQRELDMIMLAGGGGGGGGASDHGSSADSLATNATYGHALCPKKNVKLFIFAALVLVLYTSLVLAISRMYKLRLINRIGFKGPQDYLAFLQFSEENKSTEERVSPAQLKKEIDNVMDADEYVGEEEEEFREIGEFLTHTSGYVFDVINDTILDVKVYVLSVVNPQRVNKGGDAPQVLSLRPDIESNNNSGHDLLGASGGADDSLGSEESESPANLSSPTVGASNHKHTEKETPTSRKKMVSQLSMKNRLSQTSSHVKKMSMITPKGIVPPPIHTGAAKTPTGPSTGASSTESVAEKISKVAEERAARPLSPRPRRRSVITLGGNAARKQSGANASIMELLQSANLKDKDSDNQFLSKPRTHSMDFSPAGSNNHLETGVPASGGATSATPSAAAGHTKKRASIHVKHPGGMSTIEKFHMDHSKSVHGLDTGGAKRSSIDLTAVNSAAEKARNASNKVSPAAEKAGESKAAESSSAWCGGLSACLAVCWRGGKVKDAGEGEFDEEGKLVNDFMDMYLFGKPIWFFRAVELCIMFNCLYLAFWVTNFIKICSELDTDNGWKVIGQICMAIPMLVVIPAIGMIAQTSSLLTAVSELNLEVVHDVLIETEDTELLVDELRTKMLERIESVATASVNKMDIIHGLFAEIDQDGSGSIDKTEFRLLLKALKLTYSDQRFKRLYRAVDADGDNNIGRDEIDLLLNPKVKSPVVKASRSDSSQLEYEKEAAIGSVEPFSSDSPIRRRPSKAVGDRVRSLSSIAGDYSDTDSEGEGPGGAKSGHGSRKGRGGPSKEADRKARAESESDEDKPGDDLV